METPQVGSVYLVGVVFPQDINEPSPIEYVARHGHHHSIESVQSGRSPFSFRRHPAIIARIDSETNTAVIFIGSPRPGRQAHRFVPWRGTDRLPHQPLRHLTPLPRDTFSTHPGYMNFTHAIRVTVVREGDRIVQTVPGQAYLRSIQASGNNVEVGLEDGELEYLNSLHSQYWSGVRYPAGGEDDGNGMNTEDDMGNGGGNNSSATLPAASAAIATTTATQVNIDTTVGNSHAPLSIPDMVAKAFREEDERATQVELLEAETMELPPPMFCAIFSRLDLDGLDDGGLVGA